ncbi:MAG: sugar phosphate isomerase/epimerase family protein [Gemmatimonadaceae bacterium]
MTPLSRRAMLATTATAVVAAGSLALDVAAQKQPRAKGVARRAAGRLRQSASRWCYDGIPLRELCKAGARMGLKGIDLLQPTDWEVVREYGLVCSMGYPTARPDFLTNGFNNRASHRMLLSELELAIPRAAKHSVPNVIAMFGNRQGRADAQGISACIEGLNRIKSLAEEHSVTVCVELLNSKVDHKDYHGDSTAFGVEVVKGVASPRVKLL